MELGQHVQRVERDAATAGQALHSRLEAVEGVLSRLPIDLEAEKEAQKRHAHQIAMQLCNEMGGRIEKLEHQEMESQRLGDERARELERRTGEVVSTAVRRSKEDLMGALDRVEEIISGQSRETLLESRAGIKEAMDFADMRCGEMQAAHENFGAMLGEKSRAERAEIRDLHERALQTAEDAVRHSVEDMRGSLMSELKLVIAQHMHIDSSKTLMSEVDRLEALVNPSSAYKSASSPMAHGRRSSLTGQQGSARDSPLRRLDQR